MGQTGPPRETAISWGVGKDFSDCGTLTGPRPPDWLYRETITPPCNLWIAGAGHIAQAVAPLAAQLDFKVTVFDDRPALANHHYFPKEIILRAGRLGKAGRAADAGRARASGSLSRAATGMTRLCSRTGFTSRFYFSG